MSADVTTVTVVPADITQLTVTASEVTGLTIATSDTTILTTSGATINTVSLSYSEAAPQPIARSASIGIEQTVSRSDHVHSAADLLIDGGNY